MRNSIETQGGQLLLRIELSSSISCQLAWDAKQHLHKQLPQIRQVLLPKRRNRVVVRMLVHGQGPDRQVLLRCPLDPPHLGAAGPQLHSYGICGISKFCWYAPRFMYFNPRPSRRGRERKRTCLRSRSAGTTSTSGSRFTGMSLRTIETILNTFLPQIQPDERSTFLLMDEPSAKQLTLCLLLLESLRYLEAYLNGCNEFNSWIMILHPMKHRALSRHRLRGLNVLCACLNFTELPMPRPMGGVSRHVADVWGTLLMGFGTPEKLARVQAEAVTFQKKSTRQSHLEPPTQKILDSFRGLADDVKALGFHGSIGSNDHVRGLSDCDAILILRTGVVADPARLQRVRKACLKANQIMRQIDRYQHHGVLVLPEELFTCYPEDYFPTVLYESSSFDIGAEEVVSLKVVSSKWLELLRVVQFAHYVEQEAPKIRVRSYHAFHLVMQMAQLLPCFVVACCQNSMNKREAISWLAARCSDPARLFLRATGALRADWQSIWSSCSPISGVVSWPNEKMLREKTIKFFHGPDHLKESLVSLARESSRVAMGCLRSSRHDV